MASSRIQDFGAPVEFGYRKEGFGSTATHAGLVQQRLHLGHILPRRRFAQAALDGFRHAGPAKQRIEEGALSDRDREGRDPEAAEALRRHHDRLDVGRRAFGPDQLEPDLEDLAVAARVLRLVAEDIDAVTEPQGKRLVHHPHRHHPGDLGGDVRTHDQDAARGPVHHLVGLLDQFGVETGRQNVQVLKGGGDDFPVPVLTEHRENDILDGALLASLDGQKGGDALRDRRAGRSSHRTTDQRT